MVVVHKLDKRLKRGRERGRDKIRDRIPSPVPQWNPTGSTMSPTAFRSWQHMVWAYKQERGWYISVGNEQLPAVSRKTNFGCRVGHTRISGIEAMRTDCWEEADAPGGRR